MTYLEVAALYMELKERLATTTVDRVCAVVKATHFPADAALRPFAGPITAEASLRFSAIKGPLFRCMCEYRGAR